MANIKTKKVILVLLMFGCLGTFSAVAAQADWVISTIDQVGPYGINETTSGSRIFLTAVNPADAWPGSKECKIGVSRGKEFLAAALTALASGKQVRVSLNPALASPTISAIYV